MDFFDWADFLNELAGGRGNEDVVTGGGTIGGMLDTMLDAWLGGGGGCTGPGDC
jgi:hypothetical protein